MLENILLQQLCAGNGWRIAESHDDVAQVKVVIRLEPTRRSAVCSGCGETKKRFLDTKTKARSWRHLDAFGVASEIVAPLRRVQCRWCGIRVEQVPWARSRSHFTHRFEAEILRRARDSSIQGICRQLDVHWTTVMRLIERWVIESADRRFRQKLRRIGVDEVSYGRGQSKYLTIVWDHDRSCIVWIGKGKEQETLDLFFAKLGRRRSARLVCVTMDMAKGYIASVEQNAPEADIVFDRFHIERHLTDAVNEVRKREFWRRGGRYRKAIKGKKFLLLKKRKRLHWRRRRELDELLRLNRPLATAYMLKEQFADVWTASTIFEMAALLIRWRRMLRWQRLEPLLRFFRMIARHALGVLAWIRHRITNAAVESNNSRMRAISQRGRGYRNPANLMLILYHASWR